jgi:hypothetical protein
MLFPAVGRECGRAVIERDGLRGWTVDDAARVLLLAGLPLVGEDLAREVCDLYWYGDAAEKRGVLRALACLDVGDAALPVVHDALRTNDTRLIAAALGPYAAAHLDDAAYRQAVLKCVFLSIPLAWVADLDKRKDAELVRMMRAFAEERQAAGRSVPPDVLLIVPDLRNRES